MMKNRKLAIALWREEDFVVARCLQNNVSSFGANRKEAMKNVKEALSLYFEDKKEIETPVVKYPKLELIHA